MNETKELILNALSEIIRLVPEQRVGQVIANYVCASCTNNDSFFIKDNELLQQLEEIAKKLRK